MPNYRRAQVPGGTFFFTVRLAAAGDTALTDRIDDLRAAWAGVAADMPFACRAAVVLPDHLHAVWTLPRGDTDFSTRWKRIKRDFTVRVGQVRHRSASKRRKGEAGLWQRRFWEHAIRDEAEFDAIRRYIRENPVRHGHARRPEDWPYLSIR
ncbi:MAG: REP-associated tyrosine transposase [Hasllibacter sp.]